VQSSFEGCSLLCQLPSNTCRNIDGLTPGISPGEDTNRDKNGAAVSSILETEMLIKLVFKEVELS
jgi:hypothetical protein